jgi:hypothetical protein
MDHQTHFDDELIEAPRFQQVMSWKKVSAIFPLGFLLLRSRYPDCAARAQCTLYCVGGSSDFES